MKRVIWIVVAVVVGALVWWGSRPKPVRVDIGTVTRGTVRSTMEEQARTRVRDLYVISAPVQGRLLRVDWNEGDRVDADKVVAEIDPLPIQSQVDELSAQIRALESRIEGVATKKPKPEEVERLRVLEDSARKTFDAAKQEEADLAAKLDHAATELARMRELRRSQSISAAEFDQARVEETAARQALLAHQSRMRVLELGISVATLERRVLEARQKDFDWEEGVYREQVTGLKASMRSITADLKRTTITAPVSGTILTVNKRSEQVVQAGEPILEVADLRHLEIEAEFLSEDAAHMKEGMAVEVFGRALGDRVVAGRLLRIEPRGFEKRSSLGVEQQRVHVIVSIDAQDTGLRDQFRVQVRVILQVKEDVVLVPEGALFREGGRWHVFRIEDGQAQRVAVRTGIRDVRQREILSGLQPGDEVVLYPSDELADGDRIERLPPAAE